MSDCKCWTVFLLAGATIPLAAGCGSSLPQVEGVVTWDGQPLSNARVVFQAPDRPMAVATTDENGHYAVMTGSQPGMASGSYQVTVSAYETRRSRDAVEAPVPTLRTPAIYNVASTSGLIAEIQAGRNHVDFLLDP